jgi:putative transposase
VRAKEYTSALNLIEYYRFPQRLRFSRFKQLNAEAKHVYSQEYKKLLPLVEIYAFALMPNHYHLLVRQKEDKGIQTFISNFQNAFAKYYNLKSDRDGSLFKRPFKAKRVATDEECLHISRYIHLNPVTSYLIESEKLESYPLTSLPSFAKSTKNNFIKTEFILNLAGSVIAYKDFVLNQSDYQRKLHLTKHLTDDYR